MSDVKQLIAEAREVAELERVRRLARRLRDRGFPKFAPVVRSDLVLRSADAIESLAERVRQAEAERDAARAALAVQETDTEWEYTVGYVNHDGQVLAEDEDETTSDIDEAREWVQEALDSGQFSNAIVVGKPVGSPWVAVEKGGESNG